MTGYAVAIGIGERGQGGLYIASGMKSVEEAREFIVELAEDDDLKEVTGNVAMRLMAPDGKARTTFLTYQLDDGQEFSMVGVLAKDWDIEDPEKWAVIQEASK